MRKPFQGVHHRIPTQHPSSTTNTKSRTTTIDASVMLEESSRYSPMDITRHLVFTITDGTDLQIGEYILVSLGSWMIESN